MERFVVIFSSEAHTKNYPQVDELGEDSCFCLYETDGVQPIRLVATDGGEPEDQLLVRDWRWVPEELNKLSLNIKELKSREGILRARLDRVVRYTRAIERSSESKAANMEFDSANQALERGDLEPVK